MGVILYSTGCPKCEVLKSKLEDKGIEYTENNSVEEMLSMGITQVPVIVHEGKMFGFADAVKWVNSLSKN